MPHDIGPLTAEVHELNEQFDRFRDQLRLRTWITIVALVAAFLCLAGLAGGAYQLHRERQGDIRRTALAFSIACEDRKQLEANLVQVLISSRNRPPIPGETAEEIRLRHEAIDLVIAGIPTPPCSDITDIIER